MKSVDTDCSLNSITAEIMISILCTLYFTNDLANQFISLVDQAEERLDRQLDIIDRSKTIKVDNNIYSALNRIKGHETVSSMACIALKKGLAIMEMNLTELKALTCIYDKSIKVPSRIVK